MIGTILVHLALISYGIGILTEQIRHRITQFILVFLALGLIFTPLGFGTERADRWLQVGSLTFQPSELLKITYILYIAAWLAGSDRRKKDLKAGFIPFLVISGIIATLLIMQPATSTVAILLGSAIIVYFLSGAKLSYVSGLILIGLISFAVLVYATPYRLNRVFNFLNPETNLQAGNYQLDQARSAVVAGGLTGVGFGQSTTKIRYLPEPIGDSIFAVIAEEMGFVGSIVIIGLFTVLVIQLFLLAKKARGRFGQLVLVGFGAVISLQAFTHIASNIGLIPLTGVPLPFISYGGTALAVFMTMAGLSLNAAKNG